MQEDNRLLRFEVIEVKESGDGRYFLRNATATVPAGSIVALEDYGRVRLGGENCKLWYPLARVHLTNGHSFYGTADVTFQELERRAFVTG